MKKINGFSLMEVMISIGIIAVIGAFSSTLLTRTYKSTSDADLLSTLKQNGSVVSNNISESIRTADGVVCYGAYPVGLGGGRQNILVIRDVSGQYVRFRFIEPDKVGEIVKANGYVSREEKLNPDFYDTFCTAPNPSLESPMTDTNPDNGVSISSGDFKKIAGGNGKDTVSVSFIAGPPVNKSNEITTVNIQTTIQVR